MTTVKLTKDEVNEIFDSAKKQGDYVTGLHAKTLAKADIEWESVASLNQYVVAAKDISRYIWEKAMAWDKAHLDNVLAGGAWVNFGFSEEDIEEECVRFDETKIVFNARE